MSRSRFAVPVLAVVVIAAVAAFFVATSGGSTNTAASKSSAVSLEQTPLGSVLVDSGGRTLYLFEGDRPDVSTLSAAGQAIWPPVTSKARPAAMGGANVALIGTIPEPGGARQVTYNGHPLYYYVGDQHSGQTTGQGLNQFGARWYVLSSAGRAITSPGTSTNRNNASTYGY
jgi:predicted lipoprotein with Yx(FWY)xxD motif